MLSIRPAVAGDAALLWTLIHEFAKFEHDRASITEEALLRDGFGARPKFRALVAEWDSQPAGYALFFDYYSSFRGPGLFLEDIYVRSQFYKKLNATFCDEWKVVCLEGTALQTLAKEVE
jgi:hypothetical protein